jgi:integrase
VILQKLKPIQIANWHTAILKAGGQNGWPLSPTTVGQAHRVLHLALAHALKTEVVSRNVVSSVSPPKLERQELECLKPDQMASVLARLADHHLYPIAAVALGTGMRRGEILALRWIDVDLEQGLVTVERSIEQTKAGLRVKSPKTAYGRRNITLSGSVVHALRTYRKKQLEQRLALGQGRPGPEALVFSKVDGSPLSPVNITGAWRDAVKARSLPKVTFHALRPSHASALIANGVDVLTVSRRLGHASPVVTLSIYALLVAKTDAGAASVIDAAMRTGVEQRMR